MPGFNNLPSGLREFPTKCFSGGEFKNQIILGPTGLSLLVNRSGAVWDGGVKGCCSEVNMGVAILFLFLLRPLLQGHR